MPRISILNIIEKYKIKIKVYQKKIGYINFGITAQNHTMKPKRKGKELDSYVMIWKGLQDKFLSKTSDLQSNMCNI